MKKHVAIYLKAAGLSEGENVFCEICGAYATDIHHIERRGMGGSKHKDVPENLMALCRNCHDKYGDKAQYKQMLIGRHAGVMAVWPN